MTEYVPSPLPEVWVVDVKAERTELDPPASYVYHTKLWSEESGEFTRDFTSTEGLEIWLDATSAVLYAAGYSPFLLNWGAPSAWNPRWVRWKIPRLPELGTREDLDEAGQVIEI